MTQDIRFEAALQAARDILKLPDRADTAERLSQIAYAVLDAIYEAERRLAGVDAPSR